MRRTQTLSRTSRSRPRAAVVLAAVAAVIGACDKLSVEWDEQARKEILACGVDPIHQPVTPPPGTYQDQGIALDWDKLAPLPDPAEGASVFYLKDTYESAAGMEQVYHDATHGNARAAWLVCMLEPGLRQAGREAADRLAGLKCQTIAACEYRWDWLPWSRQTASGARMLAEIGGEFAAEATRLQIRRQLIADALTLGMGVHIAARAQAMAAARAQAMAAARSAPAETAEAAGRTARAPPAPAGRPAPATAEEAPARAAGKSNVVANRAAGKVGEAFLYARYGGETQVVRNTSLGRRVIDSLADDIARESKIGRTSLTKRVRAEVAKDAELMKRGVGRGGVKAVEWHFFPGATGVGPTGPLRKALEAAGIRTVIH